MTLARAGLALTALLALCAAWGRNKRVGAVRVVRVSRVVANLDRAEAFYRDALGFHTVARAPSDPAVLTALGLDGVVGIEAVMRLGNDEVALVCLEMPSRPYPADSRSNDRWFQHLAIVVADMDTAHARVESQGGAVPISQGGPQTLPPANGSVRAWKLRDPDGHPLELLWFPPGQGRAVWQDAFSGAVFLGIDHSALAVGSASRSLSFYLGLGFKVAARSRNAGSAQSRLDGLPCARLRVFGLRPASANGPGLELLAYRPSGRASDVRAGDIAADWTTLAMAGVTDCQTRCFRDPDGHMVLLIASSG